MSIEFADVKTYLESNKGKDDVKALIGTLAPQSVDSAIAFLTKDPAGIKKLGEMRDKSVNDAVVAHDKKFKEDTLPGLIAEATKGLLPAETPQEKRLRELEKKDADRDSKLLKADLKTAAVKLATEKKLPLEIAELLIGTDEAATIANIGVLETVYEGAVTAAVEARFKDGGRTIQNSDAKKLTNADLQAMSPAARLAAANKMAAEKAGSG
jgi:hypothetical protein